MGKKEKKEEVELTPGQEVEQDLNEILKQLRQIRRWYDKSVPNEKKDWRVPPVLQSVINDIGVVKGLIR